MNIRHLGRRLSALIAFFAVITGCSLASIGGRWADWYVMSELDSYFDLSKEQEKHLEPRVIEHLKWLKADILPEANKDLADLISRVERGLTTDDITWAEGRIELLRTRIHEKVLPDATWLLSRLSPKQKTHLEEELADRTKKWVKRMEDETPEEYRKRRLERYEETYTNWLGSITDEQRKQLHDLFGEFATKDQAKVYFAGRMEAQQAFLKVVSPPINELLIRTYLTTWMENPAELRTGESREQYQKRTRVFREHLLTIEKTISTDQRKSFIEKIKSYREDIEAFAKSKT